jgi:hypothetical protein
MASPKLDRTFVRRWSRAYVDGQTEQESTTEAWLFAEVGAQARRRGYLTSDELFAVGEWKSPRARSRLRSNPPDLVELVTRRAFEAPDERLTVLTSLQGVGEPMASAILSVWDPSRYTVFRREGRRHAHSRRAGAGVSEGRLRPVPDDLSCACLQTRAARSGDLATANARPGAMEVESG